MSAPKHVDVAILGAGTAGLSARRAAKAEGASVLMIDPGDTGIEVFLPFNLDHVPSPGEAATANCIRKSRLQDGPLRLP